MDYSYIQGSDILSGWSSNAGTSHTRTFEPNRDLITTVSNVYDSTAISTFAYENDALGRRTERLDTYSGVVTNSFGYNIRSEVTNAVMGADSYSWDYDPIGNRESFTENGTTLDYLVNQLNQYTNISNGVTLTPEYDSDGNMTNYNGWAYQWNGENRLRIASDGSTSVTNKYDYMGRRISKSVDGVETTFLYDGWNLVKETTGTNVTQYVWGLDLSQSLQGAGGVGGLLCVIENGEEYYPCYDANGNITEYVDSTGTNVVAHYEYSAFGKITSQSGTKADDFSFRFSTKYFDAETGLYYYGYRFYNPDLGRWVSRDPIGEDGGENLYVFVINNPIYGLDPVGHQMWGWLRPVAKFGIENTGTIPGGYEYRRITLRCQRDDEQIFDFGGIWQVNCHYSDCVEISNEFSGNNDLPYSGSLPNKPINSKYKQDWISEKDLEPCEEPSCPEHYEYEYIESKQRSLIIQA